MSTGPAHCNGKGRRGSASCIQVDIGPDTVHRFVENVFGFVLVPSVQHLPHQVLHAGFISFQHRPMVDVQPCGDFG